MTLLRKAIAEFFSTFILVFFVCGAAIVASGFAVPPIITELVVIGLILITMIYAFGRISGCHMNPAVSLGVFVSQKLNKQNDFGIKELGAYIAVQMIGGVLAALAVIGILRGAQFNFDGNFGTTTVASNIGGYIGGFVLEIVITCALVYTVLLVIHRKENAIKSALLIWFTISLGYIVAGQISGASMNPARSFAPALMQLAFGGGSRAIRQIWLFLIAPFVGGAIASILFWVLHREKTENQEQSE